MTSAREYDSDVPRRIPRHAQRTLMEGSTVKKAKATKTKTAAKTARSKTTAKKTTKGKARK